MSEGLDIIIVDDELRTCEVISEAIRSFYVWGNVLIFTDVDEAISYCLSRDIGLSIFIVDVFLGGKSGFYFLDAIETKFPRAYEDAILTTEIATDDVVNMCIASDIKHLLQKPIRPYTLQFAVRAIVTKYLKFANKLLREPAPVRNMATF